MVQKLIKFITMEEGKKIIAAEKNKKFKLAFALALGSGLRISEVVGWKEKIKPLEREQIDLKTHTIRIFGKGGKERITVTSPMLNEENLKQLPIIMPRRALQYRIKVLGKKVLGKDISFHCVDKDTEVLTDNGWKKYNEIKEGEDIFTYNLEKDKIELFKTREIFSKQYSGEMYHIKNKYIDSLVTPDHKIIAKYSTLKVIKGVRKDIWNSNKWNLIPLNVILSNKPIRQIKYKLSGLKSNWNNGLSIGKAKAGILGWILSDGCISKNKDITIQQSLTANKDKCEIISKLLNESGLKFYIKIQKEKISGYSKRKHQMIIFRIAKENSKWIFDYINKDRTPILSSFLKLNKEELENVYKNMMLGDATIIRKNSREYCGQDLKRIDFVRILSCFLNKRTVVGYKKQNGKKYFRTYITEKNNCDIHRDIIKENYKGIVWCPSTPNGTFIARRNGTIFLTGNTLRHGFANFMVNEKNIPLPMLQSMLGHSRLDTTGIYVKSNPIQAINTAWEKF